MVKEVIRAVYPRRCPGCRDIISPDTLVCSECNTRFRRVTEPACIKCGRHLYGTETGAVMCEECLGKSHHYSAGYSVFEYDRMMKQSMSDFKFNGWTDNADFYVSETVQKLGSRIKQLHPDAIIPVPVHRSKRAYRGYNQAELLAEGIGRELGITVVCDLLIRPKKTSAMKVLGSENREENLGSAFTCDEGRYDRETVENRFRKVILLDDIYTTGSTMEGCTLALLKAGVSEVVILSIAIGTGF